MSVLAIVLTERVDLGTECGYFNTWQGKCDKRRAELLFLQLSSSHLPFVWLFQHCSSSGCVSFSFEQMSFGNLDQTLLDSSNLSLMSFTCR